MLTAQCYKDWENSSQSCQKECSETDMGHKCKGRNRDKAEINSSSDAAWQKRGSGRAYNSLSGDGHVALTPTEHPEFHLLPEVLLSQWRLL
ncbi:uncharacterized protein LOC110044974 [Orbicella faveolata]|uniref:uncharacterized protein LOC110044974 n=1 Tax=Orbicella faveolata TaxID=48498 RepID=UPI0009E1E58D|nr:uncharacterized protein LOC110044974 [Orbicella faveolata]